MPTILKTLSVHPTNAHPSLIAQRLRTAIAVAFFAWVGMSLRMGLAALFAGQDFALTDTRRLPLGRCTSLKNSHAEGYFLQNILGCMLIAAIGKHKTSLNEHVATGLSAGLCGSLTTWATWMSNVAITILHGEIAMALSSVLCMPSVCMTAFKFGHYVACLGMDVTADAPHTSVRRKPASDVAPPQVCLRNSSQSSSVNDVTSSSDGERSVEEGVMRDAAEAETMAVEPEDWALELDSPHSWGEPTPNASSHLSILAHILIMSAGLIIILTSSTWLTSTGNTTGLLCMAMAPFGALLRWSLSLVNPLTAPFPVFTLIANTMACMADATSGVLSEHATSELAHAACDALSTGFGGCLSTVSTLIAELRSDKLGGLRFRSAYFLTSFAMAMAALLPTYQITAC